MNTSIVADDRTPHTSARRHVIAGLLPWIGTGLFLAHATTLVSSRPDGWQQDIVQIGVIYLIGVSCLGAGIAHLCFGPKIARSIGWTPSPFQWEVGSADLAMGIVALQAASFGADFWLAVIGINAIFRIGCGVQHIRQIIRDGNYAINNTAILFNNFAVPAFLYLAWHAWA